MTITEWFWICMGGSITISALVMGLVMISQIGAKDSADEEADQELQLEAKVCDDLQWRLDFYVSLLNVGARAAA